jgi:hypothetical protein
MVSRFTNVGTALSGGTPGVAHTWIFSAAGYDSWLANGASEASLNTYALNFATESVSSGTFTFDNTRFTQFASFALTGTGTNVATFDELRYGSTLSDVMAVIPEPSSALILLAAASSLVLIQRRRAN